MGSVTTAPRSAPGRPRDADLDAAIATATLELLAERGYHGLSITAVAERAGTTTPAVYRRWPSKAELVLGVVFRTDGDEVVADTGDLDQDVRTMIRWTLEKLGSPVGRAALAGLLGEPVGGPSVRHEQLAGVWRSLGARLGQAVDGGELRGDVDLDAQIEALMGPAMMAAIVHGEEAITAERVEALASIALDGLRAAPVRRSTRSGRPRR